MKVIFLNISVTRSIFAPEGILQIYTGENFYCEVMFTARILLRSSSVAAHADRMQKRMNLKGKKNASYPPTAVRVTFNEVLIA